MPGKTLIYDLSRTEIEHKLASWGEPNFRAAQIWQGLYRQLYTSFDEFSTLSIKLRARLGEEFSISHLTPSTVLYSSDRKTIKTLFKLPEGDAIEAVLMKYHKRRTLCISTQAGCAMGCVFCATGQMGFRRNLTSGEIVEQVVYYARNLMKDGERVTNVVYMGMGEPFHNYNATIASIKTLNHPDGTNLGARRFTISTVGLIPAIKRFTQQKSQVNLAVSLHATEDKLRSSMLPVNDRYPIDKLIKACEAYVEQTGRRITFEWALIQHENDTQEQAHNLGRLLQGMNCHVNIIPLNPTLGYSGKKSETQRVNAFKEILETYNISSTVRVRRGIDIQAGCGQLAIQAD